MNKSTDIATQHARFSEAVRAFTPVCKSRYAKLLPFQEGIVELRQKGASYRLIRDLLATIDVTVGADMIGSFIREVLEQQMPARPIPRRRPVRSLSDPSPSHDLPTPSRPKFPFTVAPPIDDVPLDGATPVPSSVPPTVQQRTRGPRIADPDNL